MRILSIICVFSPERIVLGGGVMQRRGLLEMVGTRLRELVAGYLPTPLLADEIDQFLVAAGLGDPPACWARSRSRRRGAAGRLSAMGQSATCEPMITVRSPGSPKWSMALAALRAMAMNRLLRQRCMPGSSVGVIVIRETK